MQYGRSRPCAMSPTRVTACCLDRVHGCSSPEAEHPHIPCLDITRSWLIRFDAAALARAAPQHVAVGEERDEEQHRCEPEHEAHRYSSSSVKPILMVTC